MTNARFYEIKSFTEASTTYQVRKLPDGEWRCGCIGFVMNEGKNKRAGIRPMCDHIRKVRHQKMKYHGRKKKR